MAKRIIKKIGGDRIGSGNKMNVAMHGYGYSTHDVSKIRRTSMSFGTIVPMNTYLLPSNSRLRINLDALITSNALLYQLYGSAKFQLDVFSARMALYNPKMLLNLNDQGYEISDIKFPLFDLTTRGIEFDENDKMIPQVNPSSLLAYLGVRGNGQFPDNPNSAATRQHNAMWMLMYYQIYKEYYANKQEKIGVMIHTTVSDNTVVDAIATQTGEDPTEIGDIWTPTMQFYFIKSEDPKLTVTFEENVREEDIDNFYLLGVSANSKRKIRDLFEDIEIIGDKIECTNLINTVYQCHGYEFVTVPVSEGIQLQKFDLKAIDRMQMRIMANVENVAPIVLDGDDELPYGACLQGFDTTRSINYSQEGLCVGTYQSDVFNNWLNNETINALNAKNKVKVDENGEFSIDALNITQKLYNYNMRIGVTDGTLDDWREVTYGQASKGKSLKPVYEGGLSKEILFDQIVSTASTEEEPLGSIASRGNFGSKHKGGYVQIDTDEEKLVMILCKITPRIVYNQGNDWTTNLKSLEDLHKPALDKIGYQNLSTDTMCAFETIANPTNTITTRSAGKQPAWQWYRTSYDDALGLMAYEENYKVFGREYDYEMIDENYRIKDLTTYIDPEKFNDVFALQSLDSMNFDVQVGMDSTLTLAMSEEVIPGL